MNYLAFQNMNYYKQAYILDINNQEEIFNYSPHKFFLKDFVLFVLYGLKIVGSIIFFRSKVYQTNKSILISWAPRHTTILGVNLPDRQIHNLVDLASMKIRYIECPILSLDFYRLWFSMFKSYKRRSIMYAFIYSVDVFSLTRMTRNYDCISIAGHYDRLSLIIQAIAKTENKKIDIYQHGVLFSDKRISFLYCTSFYYLFESSIPFFLKNYFSDNSPSLRKQKKKHINLLNTGLAEKTIGYISQNDTFMENIELVNLLTVAFPKIKIFVYPHPNEKKDYKIFFLKNKKISICKEKYKNSIYVTRYSTLGLELFEQGERVVFYNKKNLRLDFFDHLGEFVVNSDSDLTTHIKSVISASD